MPGGIDRRACLRQGKTTVTAALARLHRNQGRKVRVFKCGPDFLDPMILERASGAPVYQLDMWMVVPMKAVGCCGKPPMKWT